MSSEAIDPDPAALRDGILPEEAWSVWSLILAVLPIFIQTRIVLVSSITYYTGEMGYTLLSKEEDDSNTRHSG